jgi:hypothetical protein
MKYRIIEKSDLNGYVKFYPQQRKLLFLWFPFIKSDTFPVEISFDSLDAAKNFIVRQREQPTKKIHYV